MGGEALTRELGAGLGSGTVTLCFGLLRLDGVGTGGCCASAVTGGIPGFFARAVLGGFTFFCRFVAREGFGCFRAGVLFFRFPLLPVRFGICAVSLENDENYTGSI